MVAHSDTEGWSNRRLNEQIELLEEKLEHVQKWAHRLDTMLEDCAYMSLAEFDKAAKAHVEELVALVGKWVPPEMRGCPA